MTWQWFLVEGLNPEPWMASQTSVGRKAGKPYVQHHSPPQMRMYQDSLKEMFVEQNPQAVEHVGDICLWLFFWRQKTLNEMFEGKNRRAHQADATNLQKATEDALQGILYKNDNAIRDVRSMIIEQNADATPKILIGVGPYDEEAQEAKDAAVIAASLSKGDQSAVGDIQRDFDVRELF